MDLQDINVLISRISNSTGLSKKSISSQFNEANIKTFNFDDRVLVAPNDLDNVIDAWATSIKEELCNHSSTASKSPVKALTPKARRTKRPQSSVPKKKAKTLQTSADLSWPQGFENVVTHLYTPTLKKILPSDKARRSEFLNAIADETEVGNQLADELAKAIVKRSKRKLAEDKVLSGLRSKCSAMR